MNKFRASYTILNTWASGNWEQAVKYYFKLEDFVTPAMADGRTLHKGWEEHIKANKTLPSVFGGAKLKDPKPELKLVVQLHDWLELVGKIDNYDKPIIQEFKSGKMSSEKHASSMQGGVYGVLAAYSKLYAKRVDLYHYDQYSKQCDTSFVWITPTLLRNALNWVETWAGEMHQYFLAQNLYERFGKVRES